IDPIPPQALTPGEVRDVPFAATDPNNDPLTAFAVSDNTGIAAAVISAPGVIQITGGTAGSANVTVSVEDGRGGSALTTFTVTVQQTNQNPVIDPIDPQTLSSGEVRNIPFVARDPNGDMLTAFAASDNTGVATAGISAPGTVQVTGNMAGIATITVTVDDGRGGSAQTAFAVTIQPANQNPVIDPIAPQTLNAGETRDIPFVATDPDGDPLTALAVSDNAGIVSVVISAPGTVQITGAAGGMINITITVDDGRGGAAQTVFAVTVQQINQNPMIDPIDPQTLNTGDVRDIPFVARDPDGDLLTTVAESDNTGVLRAFISAPGVVQITGSAAGTANVSIVVDDGRGGSARVTFTVTVGNVVQPPPVGDQVDLNTIQVLPAITDEVQNTVRRIYTQGQTLPVPVDPGVFSVAGDTPPDQFLVDLGDGTANFGELQNAADLDALLFYYISTALPVGGNSFQSGGLLSSDTTWTAGDLLDPVHSDPAWCEAGETPLACELRTNRPAILLVLVGRNDVINGTPLADFRTQLDTLIKVSISQGAIPVLYTLPGDPARTQPYNTAIVQAAQEANVPLVNLWRGIQNNAPQTGFNPDLTLTTSGLGDQFTPEQFSTYGVPVRNILTLRVLRAVQLAVPIP
ncbi:MAG: hypothetical protein JXQ72_04655, partial [Anaerolineae bacterium]|nr:hypothetical protein [Anaerolineae bacterium]